MKCLKKITHEQIAHLLAIMTLAPSSDNIFAMPLPRPVPPPVTKATLPSKHPFGNMGVVIAGKYLARFATFDI